MEFFKALWRNFGELTGGEITLGTNAVTTLNIIVWSVFCGFIIAIMVTLYNKFIVGKAARELLKRGANSENSAVTAAEISCANPFIRFALRKNSSLRRVVFVCGDTEAEQTKYEPTSRLYIPEEKIHRAEVTYGKSDITVGSVILSLAALIAAAILALIFIPDIITLLANFFDSITPNNKYL